jgi:hypothetical protein
LAFIWTITINSSTTLTSPTDLDPYRFQTQAGLVVTVDAANNVTVYNKSGTDITTTTKGKAVHWRHYYQ